MESNSISTANRLTAYKSEITAFSKYTAFSLKAAQDGYRNIALLYKAIATSENIQAKNNAKKLQEKGTTIPSFEPVFTVKSTKENLMDDAAGDAFGTTLQLQDFIDTASKESDAVAAAHFTHTLNTEKKYLELFKNSIQAINSNTSIGLAKSFMVCPGCGNTYAKSAPENCDYCMTEGFKFIVIDSL